VPFLAEQSNSNNLLDTNKTHGKEHTDSSATPSFVSNRPALVESEQEQERETSTDSEQGDDEGTSGAYDPITGEINWDCPCLGGMAHGPCGQYFRDAFSCFVYSEEEPKGINCVDKFKAMQDCFREHPDIYANGRPFIIE
jgi:intermembrane space import and assembly protein 40